MSDNGVGIAQEDHLRIFEPFLSTKGGKGSGLGLATVFGIVRQHRGTITVHSTPGLGSTFQVYLPTSTRPARAEVPSDTPPVLRGGDETILLVEDDPLVRKVTRQALEKVGYRVIAASNGPEAVEH